MTLQVSPSASTCMVLTHNSHSKRRGQVVAISQHPAVFTCSHFTLQPVHARLNLPHSCCCCLPTPFTDAVKFCLQVRATGICAACSMRFCLQLQQQQPGTTLLSPVLFASCTPALSCSRSLIPTALNPVLLAHTCSSSLVRTLLKPCAAWFMRACPQLQQLLARQEWPNGLFSERHVSPESSKVANSVKLKNAGKMGGRREGGEVGGIMGVREGSRRGGSRGLDQGLSREIRGQGVGGRKGRGSLAGWASWGSRP